MQKGIISLQKSFLNWSSGVKSDEGYVGKFGDEKDAEKKSEQ